MSSTHEEHPPLTRSLGDNEGDDIMRSCVDCGATAPLTETTNTLMGPLHGWRLTLRVAPDGRRVGDWRCPDCWAVVRKQEK
jgi:hypothetical protein